MCHIALPLHVYDQTLLLGGGGAGRQGGCQASDQSSRLRFNICVSSFVSVTLDIISAMFVVTKTCFKPKQDLFLTLTKCMFCKIV